MHGIPPVLVFSIILYSDYRVECYKYGYRIPIRDLLGGYSAKLEKYSQVQSIIDRVRNFELGTPDITKSFASTLQTITENNSNSEETAHPNPNFSGPISPETP